MVDRPRLDTMLANLRMYVAALRRLAATPQEEFLENSDKIGNAKYHFVIAIECCIDIANHIIASQRLRVPTDYGDSFAILAENGFVSRELLESLKAMARFRNRLVHLYWDVDAHLLYSYLQDSLGDFDRFATAVASKLA